MEEDTRDELTIEDPSNPIEIFFICGVGGLIVTTPELKFKAPPKDSPHAGRLVLVTTDKGSVQVGIDNKNHVVAISSSPGGKDSQLLIRIPIGVRIFRVKSPKTTVLFYEASDGYNILPHLIPNGTEKDQEMQELLLLASPVPPRDAKSATVDLPLALPELTKSKFNARRVEDGLPELRKL